MLLGVDAVGVSVVGGKRFAPDTATSCFSSLETVCLVVGKEVTVADGLVVIGNVGDVFFVDRAFDVTCKVNFPPSAVKPHDVPGVSRSFDRVARDAKLTAHNGINVDEVTAFTSKCIVGKLFATEVFIVVCSGGFQNLSSVSVIRKVLGHPVVE